MFNAGLDGLRTLVHQRWRRG